MIAYDIGDNRRRYRVEKALRQYAVRVQKSVFEGFLSPLRQRQVSRELATLIDDNEDNLRFYPLCAWCEDAVTSLGQGGRAEEADYHVF